MNKRQIRLCRVLLDHYDSSGGQPLPLAQLARKVGYDGSDIYDRDSQSGDLWPFDGKARGPYAGMLAFTSGKAAAVTITSAGLAGLEKLMGDEPKAAPAAKAAAPRVETVEEAAPAPAPVKPPAALSKPPMRARTRPVFQEPPPPPPEPVVEPTPPAAPVAVSDASATFTAADLAAARERFNTWLSSDPAGMGLLFQYEGQVLVEAAFDKFFRDFLRQDGSR